MVDKNGFWNATSRWKLHDLKGKICQESFLETQDTKKVIMTSHVIGLVSVEIALEVLD